MIPLAKPAEDETAAPSETVATTKTEIHDLPSSAPSFGTVLFTFGLLAVAVAAFIWLGGLRYARRVLSGGRSVRYNKLGSDEGLSA